MHTIAGEPVLFEAFFTAAKIGKTGLTVLWDVFKTSLNDTTTTQVVANGAGFTVGGGVYGHRLVTGAGAFYYTALAKTTDPTVDVPQLPAGQIAGLTHVERVDAAITSVAPGINTQSLEILADTLRIRQDLAAIALSSAAATTDLAGFDSTAASLQALRAAIGAGGAPGAGGLAAGDLDAIAARLLIAPANRLATSATGGVVVGAYAAGKSPETLLLAAELDSGLTVKQSLAIRQSVVAGKYSVARNVATGVQTTTYFRFDNTTVLAVSVATPSADGLAFTRTWTFPGRDGI